MKGPKRLGLKGKRKEDVDCESGGIPLKKLIAGGAVIAILAVLALSFIPQPEFSLGSSNSLADRLAGRGLSMGKIYKHDHLLDQLVDVNAPVELVADGFQWSEGPVFVVNEQHPGYVLFSDVKQNTIFKLQPGLETAVPFLRNSGYEEIDVDRWVEPGSNGLAIDPITGSLALCEHSNRRVSMLRLASTGQWIKTPVTSTFEGKRLNSPNDLAFAANGDLYFTDPSFGFQEKENYRLAAKGPTPQLEEHPLREQEHNGVYRLRRKSDAPRKPIASAEDVAAQFVSGEPELVAKLPHPNGVAVRSARATGKARQVIVSNSGDSGNMYLLAYDVDSATGALGRPYTLFNFSQWLQPQYERAHALGSDGMPAVNGEGLSSRASALVRGPGNADGFALDAAGNVWATGPSGVFVVSPEGTWLGTIRINGVAGQRLGNVAFGDDGSLFICADNQILRVQTHVTAHIDRASF